MTATTKANVNGSFGLTSYSSLASRRVAAMLAARPSSVPTTSQRTPRPIVMRSTSARFAPIAMRMPISRV